MYNLNSANDAFKRIENIKKELDEAEDYLNHATDDLREARSAEHEASENFNRYCEIDIQYVKSVIKELEN
ncbi:MAG: hypothetical protein OXC37_01175 [Bdellovibrionaceae bacterium]|nr:hypothetical protein [Pseudobdellovibrionaceae bacterium]